MPMDLESLRRDYLKGGLNRDDLNDDPIEQFQHWLKQAVDADLPDPTAMTVATVGPDGQPSQRIVLLKGVDAGRFVFYTNYESDKGKAIDANPSVCLSFFWQAMERQVIITGTAEKIAKNLSDGYFESRPEGSKLGAWASAQSRVVPSREYLDNRLADMEHRFTDKEIPRPLHWGGFLVKPERMEFWQGRPNRMHDRICYELQKNFEWKSTRLAP